MNKVKLFFNNLTFLNVKFITLSKLISWKTDNKYIVIERKGSEWCKTHHFPGAYRISTINENNDIKKVKKHCLWIINEHPHLAKKCFREFKNKGIRKVYVLIWDIEDNDLLINNDSQNIILQ